ncbi:MAG TPA: UDP-N-acetylmuramoyl-L-alanyl-D-glutamate--2,6-diaminopimelate ligase [bacterium]|nr:UDP-N-acetylmuramoyl-L-alanyl-D-glutamate--2,6-diaminopimelate ligase [bacterium]
MKNLVRKFIPSFLLSWYHLAFSFLGATLYRFPSNKLIVIGITGTNGKSTVVDLTTQILEGAGYKTASLSSVRFKIGNKEWKNDLKMTMPGRIKLQKFLRNAVDKNCKYAVVEVTSEGIKQHRHRFIDFNIVLITNLTPEHIESHGSFERYKKAKAELFKNHKNVSIVNLDDSNSEYFLQFPAQEKYGYSLKQVQDSKIKIIIAQNVEVLDNGIVFSVDSIKFNLNLLGKFNIYNSLAAICVALSQGINLKTCKNALEKVKGSSGRMEKVVSSPFNVIVDYAHTPDALSKVYKVLDKEDSKLICVLGSAGGGRDKWKRPELGKIASIHCDKIILTNEDPYDENPAKILFEIKTGIPGVVEKILNRREAIKKALSLAKEKDTVVITGKGCEPWMCVEKGKKIPWDDREVVKEELNKLLTK